MQKKLRIRVWVFCMKEDEDISYLTDKINEIIKDKKYINWKKNELTNHVNAANEIVKHIEEYLNK